MFFHSMILSCWWDDIPAWFHNSMLFLEQQLHDDIIKDASMHSTLTNGDSSFRPISQSPSSHSQSSSIDKVQSNPNSLARTGNMRKSNLESVTALKSSSPTNAKIGFPDNIELNSKQPLLHPSEDGRRMDFSKKPRETSKAVRTTTIPMWVHLKTLSRGVDYSGCLAVNQFRRGWGELRTRETFCTWSLCLSIWLVIDPIIVTICTIAVPNYFRQYILITNLSVLGSEPLWAILERWRKCMIYWLKILLSRHFRLMTCCHKVNVMGFAISVAALSGMYICICLFASRSQMCALIFSNPGSVDSSISSSSSSSTGSAPSKGKVGGTPLSEDFLMIELVRCSIYLLVVIFTPYCDMFSEPSL